MLMGHGNILSRQCRGSIRVEKSVRDTWLWRTFSEINKNGPNILLIYRSWCLCHDYVLSKVLDLFLWGAQGGHSVTLGPKVFYSWCKINILELVTNCALWLREMTVRSNCSFRQFCSWTLMYFLRVFSLLFSSSSCHNPFSSQPAS